MSKIKDLKTNPEINFNLIEVLELFSPDKKSKYTDTLFRLMKSSKNLDSHVKEITHYFTQTYDFIKSDELNKFSNFQILLIYRFIDSFFETEDLKNFRKFCEYNERGLINQNDLTKYKSFAEIMNQLSLAELKIDNKGLENEIIKVYEDEEWLLIRPLTYLSSRKYGSNTKWCTTTEGNPEYFMKYTKRGILIYCINKKTGYKVASFYSLDKNEPEFSFWNQKDSRIDSLDSELTDDLRKVIQTVSKDPKAKTNRFLLSDETRQKEEKFLKLKEFKSGSLGLNEPVEMEQPSEEGVIAMRNRIENAIRRENDDVDVTEHSLEQLDDMLEEREIERTFEDSENTYTTQEPNIAQEMQWGISTTSTSNFETE